MRTLFCGVPYYHVTSLLSRDLTDSLSVPGKCLITAEKFDTKTTWSGSSLRYSVVVRTSAICLDRLGSSTHHIRNSCMWILTRKYNSFLSFKNHMACTMWRVDSSVFYSRISFTRVGQLV